MIPVNSYDRSYLTLPDLLVDPIPTFLPKEVVQLIFHRLPTQSLLTCASVNKKWSKISSTFPDWTSICVNKFFSNRTPSDKALDDIINSPKDYYLSCFLGTYSMVKEFGGSKSEVTSMLLEGDQLFCGHLDGSIIIRNATDHDIETTLKHHTGMVNSLKVHESILISNSTDGLILFYDLERQEIIKKFKIPNNNYAFEFQLVKGTLIAGCEDGNVHFWDYETGKLKDHHQQHNTMIASISIHDGKFISASTDGEIIVWDELNEHAEILDADSTLQWITTSSENNLVSFSFDDADTMFSSWSMDTLEKKDDSMTLSLDFVRESSYDSEILKMPVSYHELFTLNGTSMENLKYYSFNGEMLIINEYGINLSRCFKHKQTLMNGILTNEVIQGMIAECVGKDLYISLPNDQIQLWTRELPRKKAQTESDISTDNA